MNQYQLGLKSTISTASWGCYFLIGKKMLANQRLSLSLEQEKWRVDTLRVGPSGLDHSWRRQHQQLLCKCLTFLMS